MTMPIIQFKSLDDFIDELLDRRSERTVRLWPSTWRTGSQVQTVWSAVTCQSVLHQAAAHPQDLPEYPHSIGMVSVVIGTYPEMHGHAFGPQAERRQAIIEQHSNESMSLIRKHLGKRLPEFRLAAGSIYTGLAGAAIQVAYWNAFDPIYQELRNEQ